MPRAKLTVVVPEEVWIGEISRSHPEARFRVLAALPDGETGVGLVEITTPDIGSVVAAVESAEDVTDLHVLQRRDDGALVQFETSAPLLLSPLQRSGVPLEMPFDIRDGEAVWEVTASRESLSTLGEQFDALGVRYRVEYIRQQADVDRPLTDQQRRLVHVAVERGYYDTPRRCSLTELADELGLAKSSVSETLHRAEERIVKEFVEGLSGPVDSGTDSATDASDAG